MLFGCVIAVGVVVNLAVTMITSCVVPCYVVADAVYCGVAYCHGIAVANHVICAVDSSFCCRCCHCISLCCGGVNVVVVVDVVLCSSCCCCCCCHLWCCCC